MKPVFREDFVKRLMHISFEEPVELNLKNIEIWQKHWFDKLKFWHSPYKALIDISKTQFVEEGHKPLLRMFQTLKSLYLRKVVAFGGLWPADLPFVHETEALAREALGVRTQDLDLEAVHIEDDFVNQFMEASFGKPSQSVFQELEKKIAIHLRQWHSPWNLLMDTRNLVFDEDFCKFYEKFSRRWKGFFLMAVVGYGPKPAFPPPFPIFSSRHKALQHLKKSSQISSAPRSC